VEETKPVTCLCAANADCGCDDTGNSTFLDTLIGDGTTPLNASIIQIADVNGTSTIVLNGTLEAGTTDGTGDAASTATNNLIQVGGYWVMVALVGCTVLFV